MTAYEILDLLQKKGFKAFFIGGYVRDLLIGIKSGDIDVVTSAIPDEILNIFKDQKVNLVGENFGVVIVDNIEVATFRADKYAGFSHLDCKITFSKTLEEDVIRRDFTCNGIAFDPNTGEFFDYVNGQEDIKNKIIRFIGNPQDRIFEDPNRIIRACRFLAKLNFDFTQETYKTLLKYSSYIEEYVRKERIRLELLKAMEIKKASIFFRALYDIGALNYILPSLNKCYNHPGGPYHIEDVFDHCMMAGDHVSTKYPLIKLAGYLHDVGKAISSRINPRTDDIWFEGHEETGYEAVKNELEILRFSRDEINKIASLVKFHMRISNERLSPKSVRRTLKLLYDSNIKYQELLRVSISDKMGGLKSQKYYKIQDVYKLAKYFRDEINRKPVNKFSDLAIDGFEVMGVTGLKPGKEVGVILNWLMNLVIDDPDLNEKDKLFELLKERKGYE